MPSGSSPEQKALLLSLIGLVAITGWLWREWLKGPTTMEEVDRQQALKDARRVKRQAKRPEWLRRLVRRWDAAGKLGERVHTNGEKR